MSIPTATDEFAEKHPQVQVVEVSCNQTKLKVLALREGPVPPELWAYNPWVATQVDGVGMAIVLKNPYPFLYGKACGMWFHEGQWILPPGQGGARLQDAVKNFLDQAPRGWWPEFAVEKSTYMYKGARGTQPILHVKNSPALTKNRLLPVRQLSNTPPATRRCSHACVHVQVPAAAVKRENVKEEGKPPKAQRKS